MTARAAILDRIRRNLGATGPDADRRRTVAERLASPPTGTVPARGHGDTAARIATFTRQAEIANATVGRVGSADEIPATIAAFLAEHGLPRQVRMGADPRLATMPWSAAGLATSNGASRGDDPVAVSHATAGVAETGTLVLLSGPDNPTTLNFLPDTHLVVVNAADIAPDLETIWARLRDRYGKGAMPRTVNLTTGPSRSADIEQTLVVGAHGPRRLHILIVGELGEGDAAR